MVESMFISMLKYKQQYIPGKEQITLWKQISTTVGKIVFDGEHCIIIVE